MTKAENTIHDLKSAAQPVSDADLHAVNGGLTIATYPVKAIRIFGFTAYVSNGELVGVRCPDGTVKPA